MQSNRNEAHEGPYLQDFPSLTKKILQVLPYKVPKFSLSEPRNFNYDKFSGYDIIDDNFAIAEGVKYDINRVSSRNAKKSELGPYKNSFLRKIITSHGMGKASGTKQELVSTILSHHEAKSH